MEKSSNWQRFNNTKELLAHVATEYGYDALFSGKYFSDHADTLLPKWQKNLVKQAFECGAVKLLQDGINAEQSEKERLVKVAVRKLVDTYRSGKEDAEQIIWEFTNALGWGMSEPQGQNKPSIAPPPVSPPPSSPPSSNPNINKLMIRAWQFAEDGDWRDSADYFNKVLDSDPSYAPAFLGLLCVDLEVSKEDNLANVKDPVSIINHKYYKRAITDPAVKYRLDGYIQTIKNRIDMEQKAARAEAERQRKIAEEKARKKRIQDIFDDACKIMNNAKTPDDYRKAITAFGKIDSNYQDINNQINSKISECERKIKQVTAELDKVLAPLREKFDPKVKAKEQARLQEKRKIDIERLNIENEKAKAAAEAQYAKLQKQYNAEYKAWQDDVNKHKAQSEIWKSQELCPRCGGTLKGLFSKKCSLCGTESNNYQYYPPCEPQKPKMPIFTPRKLDESQYVIKDDSFSQSGAKMRVTIDGIDWLVLDVKDDKVLLISEKILEERSYHKDIVNITWENCDLRKYLNNEFYNKLGAIKSAIATTNNQNLNNQWYGTSGGNNTKDKIFLLNLDEVCRYFGDSTANLRKKGSTGSDYWINDKNNPNRVAKYGNKACWWWLRSPGLGSDSAAFVIDDGYVIVSGNIVIYGSGGVRPALWLNL